MYSIDSHALNEVGLSLSQLRQSAASVDSVSALILLRPRHRSFVGAALTLLLHSIPPAIKNAIKRQANRLTFSDAHRTTE